MEFQANLIQMGSYGRATERGDFHQQSLHLEIDTKPTQSSIFAGDDEEPPRRGTPVGTSSFGTGHSILFFLFTCFGPIRANLSAPGYGSRVDDRHGLFRSFRLPVPRARLGVSRLAIAPECRRGVVSKSIWFGHASLQGKPLALTFA